ncbi:ribosomal protein L21-like protein [Daedaleopsis nitida]|nr:ribosomal protein L21-like protein [Daedaleopsis nitida]
MAYLLRPTIFRAVSTRALHTQTVPSPSTASNVLSLIRSQPSQYVVASVAGRKYLLTSRDLLTVPRLKDVKVGDVLKLSDIHELGSREYTIQQVSVEATVVEHTKGSMEVIFKKKRRKGYERTVRHKQTYTRLRIGPIDIVENPSS